MRQARLLLSAVFLATLAACGGDTSLPDVPRPTGVQGGGVASLGDCQVDTAQVRQLLTQAFSQSPDANAALGKWNNIQHQVNTLNDLAAGKQKVFNLVDFIFLKLGKSPTTLSQAQFASLLNQLFCFVGIESNITDPTSTWIVYVGDPLTTFVTPDKLSGIQFPANAVVENTIVTATPKSTADLVTLLDKYPFVYDWSLSPAQTLAPGLEAVVGVCPNPAVLDQVPPSELDALLARLVLGHQQAPNDFNLLERVPIPPEMVLDCGQTTVNLQASIGRRMIDRLASVFLPATAHAAALRGFVGGVGGSTREFSPFGPVDPELNLTGGVGGSTREFLRLEGLGLAALAEDPVTVDGTVGTTRTTNLPSLTVRTFNGTAIPGVIVTWTTLVPQSFTPAGDASVCGPTVTMTDPTGFSTLGCLAFGTTAQYRSAYTTLKATVAPPPGLDQVDANGVPILQFAPSFQNWLVKSSGASTLAFTAPPSGQQYVAGATIPATVEIRSDLGDKVTAATNQVTLTLNKNAFLGGATSLQASAVAGVATFAAQIGTAATGYQFGASATLGDAGTVSASPGSNLFDVLAGAPSQIAAVGTQDYGLVAADPVTPPPAVRVSDQYGNPTDGATVYWMPGGASGATANGSTGTTSGTTAGGGLLSASWFLGEGDNQLRASLQAGPGGAEVFFTASRASTISTINACAPGGAKDDIESYYFVIPGPSKTNGLVKSVGLYLSAAGAVGQTDPNVGYPMTLVATRVVGGVTQTFTSTATAFLRGDNGASSANNRLVTFNFDIPPAGVNGQQPDLTVRFAVPAGGYGRKINFNAGTCGPGKCTPPPGCDAKEFPFPIGSSSKPYRNTVGLVVRGR